MSGYRTLHRQQVESTAIWNVQTSPLLVNKRTKQWRIWTASADGFVRAYYVKEKDNTADTLDASALTLTCTHICKGSTQEVPTSPSLPTATTTTLGCTQLCLVRNYTGEDEMAGELIVASLELSGKVRIWTFSETEDEALLDSNNNKDQPPQIRTANAEFLVANATGTVMTLCQPRVMAAGQPDVCVAVACLDGTIAQVSTGLVIHQRVDGAPNEAQPTGTILDRWGSPGSAVPLCIASHPTAPVWAIGRYDGSLDILSHNQHSAQQQPFRRHRLHIPAADVHDNVPVRAVAYTPDGNFIVAGNDHGQMVVWDVGQRTTPTLVHHELQAHASWILDISPLPGDSRRWITGGADRKVHVWKTDQLHQPVHTYDSDQTVWTMAPVAVQSGEASSGSGAAAKPAVRLVCGTDTGWLQVLSVDG